MFHDTISSKSSKQQKAEKDDEGEQHIFDHDTLGSNNQNNLVDDYVTKLSSNHVEVITSKSSKNGALPSIGTEPKKSAKSAKVKTSKSSKTSAAAEAADSPSLFESEDLTQVISPTPMPSTESKSLENSVDSSSLFESDDEQNRVISPTLMPSVTNIVVGVPSTDTQVGMPKDSSSPTTFLDRLSIDSLPPTSSPMSTNSSFTSVVANSSDSSIEPDDLEYIDGSRISDKEDVTGALRYSTKASINQRNAILAYGLALISVLFVLATVGLIATRRKQLIDEMMKQKTIQSGTPQSSFEEVT